MVTFAQEFRHYLLGRKFIIRRDHSALRWVTLCKEPQDQMARWLEVLSQFDFVVQHRVGKKHGNADGPSRIPCEPDGCDCYDGKTILAELQCRGCDICRKRHQEWSSFFAEVDDGVPLSARCVQPQQERVPGWGMRLLLFVLMILGICNTAGQGIAAATKECCGRVSQSVIASIIMEAI